LSYRLSLFRRKRLSMLLGFRVQQYFESFTFLLFLFFPLLIPRLGTLKAFFAPPTAKLRP
jgi:hypothetical protein